MRRRSTSEYGATFVEAALIFPIIIGLIMAVLTLGFAISQNALFTDSVRAAGRAAVATLGDCDAKQEKAENVLSSQLMAQGLSYHDIQVETASIGDSEDEVGFNKRGLEIKVRGKLAGIIDVQYSAFSAFEGDNEC